MQYISKSKFFNRYLPMFLAVVLIVVGGFVYLIFEKSQIAEAATATYDNSASSYCDDGATPCGNPAATTLTYSLTVGSNSNRQLAVFAFVGCNSGETVPTVTSVTYAGVSLTQTVSVNPAAARRGYLYTLPAGTQPATGANNVVVTMSTDLDSGGAAGCGNDVTIDALTSGAISVYNVDQTNTYASTPLSNSGSGTSATLTGFTSGANDLGIESICSGDAETSTTETSRWINNGRVTNSCGRNAGATAASGDTSFSYTISSDSWIIIGGAFKAASATAHVNIRGGGSSTAAVKVRGGGSFTPTFGQLSECNESANSNFIETTGTCSGATPFSSPIVAGNIMIVWIWYNSSSASVNSVVDTGGNTYQRAVGPTTGTGALASYRQEIWYSKITTGGAAATYNVTTTLSSTFNATKSISAHEYSGISDLDTTSSNATTGTNGTSGTATTAFKSELIFGAAVFGSSGTSGSGFNQRSSIAGNASEDENVTSTGSNATTFTNSSQAYIAQMATFKATSTQGVKFR